MNYTFAMFLKHHTIDIVLRYCAPHISSVGSIDDRDSTSVAKMSGVFFFLGRGGGANQKISKLTVKKKGLTRYIQETRTEDKSLC